MWWELVPANKGCHLVRGNDKNKNKASEKEQADISLIMYTTVVRRGKGNENHSATVQPRMTTKNEMGIGEKEHYPPTPTYVHVHSPPNKRFGQ